MSKIFGSHEAVAKSDVPPASSAASAPSAQANTSPTNTSAAPSATPQQPVDVAAVLTGLASKNSQQLNWRTSIVDLMKLLDLDSSLNARKELAHRIALQRRHERLGVDEHLAAQASHAKAGGERRQGAGRPQVLAARAAGKAGQGRDQARAACAGELHATSSAKSGRARAKARPGRELTKRGSQCGANLALARRSSLKSE